MRFLPDERFDTLRNQPLKNICIPLQKRLGQNTWNEKRDCCFSD
jgi:hypothetical protein